MRVFALILNLIPRRVLAAIAIAVVDYIIEATPTQADDKLWDSLKKAYKELKDLARKFGKPEHKQKIVAVLKDQRSTQNNS